MYRTVAAVAVVQVRKQKNERDSCVTIFVAPVNEYKNFYHDIIYLLHLGTLSSKIRMYHLYCVVEEKAVRELQDQGMHECMCVVLCVYELQYWLARPTLLSTDLVVADGSSLLMLAALLLLAVFSSSSSASQCQNTRY